MHLALQKYLSHKSKTKLPFNLHKNKTQNFNITNLNVSDMQPVRHNFSNQYKIGISQYDEDKCYYILRFFCATFQRAFCVRTCFSTVFVTGVASVPVQRDFPILTARKLDVFCITTLRFNFYSVGSFCPVKEQIIFSAVHSFYVKRGKAKTASVSKLHFL